MAKSPQVSKQWPLTFAVEKGVWPFSHMDTFYYPVCSYTATGFLHGLCLELLQSHSDLLPASLRLLDFLPHLDPSKMGHESQLPKVDFIEERGVALFTFGPY